MCVTYIKQYVPVLNSFNTYIFKSPIHKLKFLLGELCVPAQLVQALWLVPNDLQFQVIEGIV